MIALLVAAGLSVLVGAMLQSATGFGFALVTAPLLFAALGPQEAIGTLLVLASEGSLLVLLAEGRRPRPLVRDAAVIVAASLPGAFAGVAVLRSLDVVALQLAVTAGVIVALLVRWRAARGGHKPRGRPGWSAGAAGLAAGALTTSTNTSGPPLLLHLTGRSAEPAQVRDTINVCFLGLSAVSATALVVTQTASAAPELWVLAATAPLVVLGNLAGRPIFARLVHSGDYERVLTGVLVVAVTAGLLTTLL